VSRVKYLGLVIVVLTKVSKLSRVTWSGLIDELCKVRVGIGIGCLTQIWCNLQHVTPGRADPYKPRFEGTNLRDRQEKDG
jgi:hypothetical protein